MRRATLMMGVVLGLAGCTVSERTSTAQTATLAAPSALADALDAILTNHDTNAIYGARVVRVSDGAELYAHNADVPMIPASNIKLPTSAAALDHFGADHTFDTQLYFDGTHLTLVGSGDPALGDPTIAKWHDVDQMLAFDQFADALAERGVKSIPGDLIYNDAVFEGPMVAPSWDTDDLVYWYAAPVSGLNFNDNCIDPIAVPGAMGEPATIEYVPATTDSVHIVNLTTTTEGEGNEVSIEKTQNASVYAVVGDVFEKETFKSRPVSDPGYFTADVLSTHLAKRGITLQGTIRQSTDAPAGELIATAKSAMPDVMRRVNTNSQNLFAEALSKLLGKATDNGATWEGGNAAIVAFFEDAGIDSTGFEAVDGSGLSRDNRVTVRQLSELMLHMTEHEDAETFRDSLTIGGEVGTLASRFADTNGNIRGKTGYIGGVRALTVYATDDDGETYIVSILFNQIPGSVKPFEKLQDEAIMTVLDVLPYAE